MRKTYTIEITEPGQELELNVTVRAMDLWLVMSDALSELRTRCKYGEGDTSKLEEFRTYIWNELSERGLGSFFL